MYDTLNVDVSQGKREFMELKAGVSRKITSENIDKLMREGHTREEAVKIAYRFAGKSPNHKRREFNGAR